MGALRQGKEGARGRQGRLVVGEAVGLRIERESEL